MRPTFSGFSSTPVLSSGIIVVSAMKRVGAFASGSGQRAVGAPGRCGGMAISTVRLSRVGGKKSAMLRGTGRGSLSGMLKGSPSGKDSARMDDGHGAVAQGLGIKFQPHESIGLEPEFRDPEVRDLFEKAALHLKVMRPEVHALRPHNL